MKRSSLSSLMASKNFFLQFFFVPLVIYNINRALLKYAHIKIYKHFDLLITTGHNVIKLFLRPQFMNARNKLESLSPTSLPDKSNV
jgi:hypothetical protein